MAIVKKAVVSRVVPFNDRCQLIELSLPLGETLGFRGGQYIIVNAGCPGPEEKEVKRAYSVLSADSQQSRFLLAAERVPSGFASGYLNDLVEGDSISFTGPWGKKAAEPWPKDSLPLVIATDTGITAALGTVNGRHFETFLSRARFKWMVSADNAFLSEAFVRESAPKDLHAIEVVKIPPIGSAERLQVASEQTKSWLTEETPNMVYMTGDGHVLNALTAVFREFGLTEDQIRSEPFFRKGT